MKKSVFFLAGMGAMFAVLAVSAYTNESGNGNEGTQSVHAPKIPSQMDIAGERVPLEIIEVRERVDREILMNTFAHAATFNFFKLGNRFFPVIEPLLAANGVPDDFKYLAVIESGLRNVGSPAGAKGYWQFLKATAIQFGLEVNDEVDERNDIEKSTVAACRYLSASKERFGSWTAAAAAYNMGDGGFTNSAKAQFSNNYYDLYLNMETSRYVPRILAVKEIMKHPDQFGFNLDYDDYYPKLDDVTLVQVSETVPMWSEFAKANGISLATFKFYNPWAIGPGLSNKAKKTYMVKIPKGQKRIE